MKQQVLKVLDSNDGGQGAVTLSTMEEALMLAQVIAFVKRPSVHIVFNKGNKHAVRYIFHISLLFTSLSFSLSRFEPTLLTGFWRDRAATICFKASAFAEPPLASPKSFPSQRQVLWAVVCVVFFC
jgi:hypothetical protein